MYKIGLGVNGNGKKRKHSRNDPTKPIKKKNMMMNGQVAW